MMSTVTSQNIYALIVGIEKYDDSDHWHNLDGSANAALTFTRWLYAQNVPPANINLCLSLLDTQRDLTLPEGIAKKPATYSQVFEILNKIACIQGEMFFLFWAGHGVIKNEEQRLIFADATERNLLNLNLEREFDALRTEAYRGFSRQFCFVDACATYIETIATSEIPHHDIVPKSREKKAFCEQYAYFAAKEGENARTDRLKKVGYFSEVLMEELERQTLSLDLANLSLALEKRFEQLHRTNSKFTQTPNYSWIKRNGSSKVLDYRDQASPRISPLYLPSIRSLIGREEKLAQLVNVLSAETSGISALVGMPGVGKTALAAEVVLTLFADVDAFPRGAVWVSCEDLQGESGLTDLWTRVARLCDLQGVATEPDPARKRLLLAADLAEGKRILLALDNIEPGLDVETLCKTLHTRDHTVLLLTARQYVVPQQARTINVNPLTPDQARTLFLHHFQPPEGTELMPEDQKALATLLEAFGGLPLALELTANYARIQKFRLTTIVQEIEDDGLDALALRDDEHSVERTLLKRFERSWIVLSPYQQQLFAGLSLLTGPSFPRTAAMALAASDNFPVLHKTEDDPKIALFTLIKYALVEALPGGERLRLHQLFRTFAASKLKTLSQTLQKRIGDAMVAYWLEYAQAHRGREKQNMDALEAEIEGLKGAVDWAYQQTRYQELLDLTHALSNFLFVRGRNEARFTLTLALKAAITLGNEKEILWTTHQVAMLDGRTKRFAEATAGFEKVLALARRLKDVPAERAAIRERALIDQKNGSFEEARKGYTSALALSEQLDDLSVKFTSVHDMAVINHLTGHFSEAQRGFEQSLALAKRLEDPNALSVACSDSGFFLSQHGDPAHAYEIIHEGLRLSKELKNTYRVGKCYQYLASLEGCQGKKEDAITHYREALHCFAQVYAPEVEEIPADLAMLEANAEVADVLRAFIDLKSRSEVRAFLEQKKEMLVRDEVDLLLSELIKQVRQNVNVEQQKARANVLKGYRLLLRKASSDDISAAWNWFEQAYSDRE